MNPDFFKWAWFFYQVTVGIGTVILVFRLNKFCNKIESFLEKKKTRF